MSILLNCGRRYHGVGILDILVVETYILRTKLSAAVSVKYQLRWTRRVVIVVDFDVAFDAWICSRKMTVSVLCKLMLE